MKEKLEVIREALLSGLSFTSHNTKLREGITLLDTLIAELESAELVEKIAEAHNNADSSNNYSWKELVERNIKDGLHERYIKDMRIQAQAVINAIK